MQFYKCKISTMSRNSAGGAGPIVEVTHSRADIIRMAREEAGKSDHGDLEGYAGIATKETPDGWEYERQLSGEEEFETALDFLRRDGHIFDVEEA